MEKSTGRNIIFVGNSGVGKSYLCNRIFKLCNTSTKFESSCSLSSVTENIQSARIAYYQQMFNVVDTPGFCNSNSNQRTDGENYCKLIKTLESYCKICAIVFVFIDRFAHPHQIWLERIVQLISTNHFGHIILLHNKTGKLTPREIVKNETVIEQLVGCQVTYFPFEIDGSDESAMQFLENISHKMPFTVKINQIPELCYSRTQEGEEYELIISKTITDHGRFIESVRDTSHWEIDEKKRNKQVAEDLLTGVLATGLTSFGGPIGGVFAIGLSLAKTIAHAIDKPQIWVTSQVSEKIWEAELVTEIVYGIYIDTFKIRYDGTKDKTSTTEVRRKTIME